MVHRRSRASSTPPAATPRRTPTRTPTAPGWTEFLALLKKYRGRRPLNGVLVAISAQDLLTQGDAAREAHVDAARRRLDELSRELQIQLPVYLLVTKCDLVAGFTEYFDDLTPEGRAQVWGTTFPYEQTRGRQRRRGVPAEFDALVERLNERLFDRLQEERDAAAPREDLRVSRSRWPRCASRSSEFVTDVFAADALRPAVLLRGVYLTSGTQEGTPIDRLLGALAGALPSRQKRCAAPAARVRPISSTACSSRWCSPSRGWPASTVAFEVRMAAWQLALTARLLGAAVIGVMALTVSYRRNQTYLADVAASLERLAETSAGRAGASHRGGVAAAGCGARACRRRANAHRAQARCACDGGSSRAGSIGDAAREAYVRELDGALLPRSPIAARDSGCAVGTEPEQLYQYLKAYLMLGQPEPPGEGPAWLHCRPGLVARRPTRTRGGALAALSVAPRAAIAGCARSRSTRRWWRKRAATIRQASTGRLVYSELRLRFANDDSALRLDVSAGIGVERVLRRKSGSAVVAAGSGLYTGDVFKRITGGAWSRSPPSSPSSGSGVMGRRAADRGRWSRRSSTSTRTITSRPWDGVLKDIDIVRTARWSVPRTPLDSWPGRTSPLRGL